MVYYYGTALVLGITVNNSITVGNSNFTSSVYITSGSNGCGIIIGYSKYSTLSLTNIQANISNANLAWPILATLEPS